MSARQAAAYQVEELRRGPDGVPLWGVRRPDGGWITAMGRPEWCVSRRTAEQIAAERNRATGTAADPG
ncbi:MULTISPECIES: hypothetical protein [unclassified Kitasatospora]|uniref:hypothetical protein n=1 Tax=unclassified Kitasatospora TaxID=2633591 RepID=UPI0038187274